MARTVDSRHMRRYRLRTPVNFSWRRSDGDELHGEGFTRDISPCGVYVVCAEVVPSGTSIDVEVRLPSLRAGRHAGACLRTQGHVVRSESLGFAVCADLGFRMQFSDTDSRQGSLRNVDENGGMNETKQLLAPVSRFSM